MRKIFCSILLVLSFTSLSAKHIKGGFFTYKYLGAGITNPSYLRYKITLTVYMDQLAAEGQQIDDAIHFSVFSTSTNALVADPEVRKTQEYFLEKFVPEPCIQGTNITGKYYKVVIYELDNYELPVSTSGYTISYQRCCRIDGMENITNSGDIGNTYTITIPGTSSPVADANKNSSPDFLVNDTVVVCQNSFFSYPFKAIDSDGDSLSYSLCSAFLGGAPSPRNAPTPDPAAAPPYISVPYQPPFNGSRPMGSPVTINSTTGLISGIAPPISSTNDVTDEYVVTVCVAEYRNGIHFADSRKELHIRVKDCDPIQAQPSPKDKTCDGFTRSFSNQSATPSGTDYLWDFDDPSSSINNTSTSATPTHTYTDTGVYQIKLRVSLNGLCTDSTTFSIKVYPGFFPGFTAIAPFCKGQPVQFKDTSKTNYGSITGWRWAFGDPLVTNDTSHLKDPTYTYTQAGNYQNLQFIAANTFGCIDTLAGSIKILDSPPLQVTNDTIICIIDTIQLTALGSGNMIWSPNYMINNIATATPLVSPDMPTKYFVALTDAFGCKNNDSVFVDVRSFITANTGKDTTICKGDPVILHVISEGLQYNWSPATGLDNSVSKNPIATPQSSTTYQVVANIGKCVASDIINITVVPYPAQQIKKDTGVCINLSTHIYTSGGSSYSWSPTAYLSNPNISNPLVINPRQTIGYIVSVTDTLGCPKPTFDTFTVRVIPKIIADAGPRDTIIALGEPLYLHASGAEIYSWSPSAGLSDPNSQNPIADLTENMEYVLLAQTKEGCKGLDTISVKVYKIDPDLYVPTAFSPNGDGINDVFKPILLGIKRLDYFNIFNRWGQLVFSSSNTRTGLGWDGTLNGKPQDPGTYIWQVKGISYQGKNLFRKGYVVLVK